MIPRFTAYGVLPHDGVATLKELRLSHLVTGEGSGSVGWDAAWRGELVNRVGHVFELFMIAGGVTEFWLDGSFVEAVDRPGDVDAYFTLRDPREWLTLPDRLNALDEGELWTWETATRRVHPGSIHPKPPFWGKYRVDIYPDLGRPSGIFDADGNALTFAQAFRQQRVTYSPRGIVHLVREP